MFTTCPNCRMNLAVTPVDLRIGQGYVRCGRCERVFNALLSLAEDLEQEQQSGLAATGTTTVPALDEAAVAPSRAQDPPATAAPAVDADALPDDVPLPDMPQHDEDSSWAKITPIRQQAAQDMDVVESTATGTFETIVLEGDGYLQTEEHVDETEVDAQLQELARQMDARQAAPAEPGVEVDEQGSEDVVMEAATEVPEIDAEAAVGNTPRQHWGWTVAAAALLLTLVAQLVHHNRQALVAHPWFERPLQALYAAFGVTLEPAWDLRAYDLRQLGGEALSGTAETIVLRAAVHNRATTRQPPPMIRAVLQDRFGNALSTTAIAPQDYLQGPVPARMAPDQRLDAALTLSDPNRQAVGFELDACLPGADGRLHCSNDP